MKIIIPFLILLILFSTCLFSQERGLKKVVRTPQGKEIPLYKGSYALVVGNGKYTTGWDELLGPVKDVEEIADALRRNGFKVTLVKNVDKETFLSELSNFTYKYGQDEGNQLLFYYAGHGHTTTLASNEELGYLVMIDTPVLEKDPQGFDIKSVDMQTIITYAKKIKSKHVLFMFDCCFSGTILNLREKVTPKAISDAVQYPVRQFITAGRAEEPVPDRSIFKQIFLDLLEGRREEPIKDGYLTGEELGLYLKNTVPEYYNFQHPQYGKIRDPNLDLGDFVFVLEKSIEINPKYAIAYYRRGGAYFNKSQYDKAIVDYTRAIEINPKYAMAYTRRGGAYFNKGQYDKAIVDHTRAIEINPKFARAYASRGYCYDVKGLFDQAIADFTKAIELAPDRSWVYLSRGLIYQVRGLYDQAIADFTKSIQLDPKYVIAFHYKAFSCEKAGRINEALEAYKAFIQNTPPLKHHSLIERAKKRIIELEK